MSMRCEKSTKSTIAIAVAIAACCGVAEFVRIQTREIVSRGHLGILTNPPRVVRVFAAIDPDAAVKSGADSSGVV